MALIDVRKLAGLREKGFVASLTKNLSLRLHVSLIIAFSWCCGFLATWMLHNAGVDSLILRYGVALFAAYAAFLAGVRMWFWCVFKAAPARSNLVNDTSDALNDLPSFNVSGSSGRGVSIPAPKGGGGTSGGAGASASWDDSPASSVSSGGGGGGGSLDIDVGDGDSVGAIVVAICLVAVALTVVITMIYVVAIGPHMLSEAAFQFLLAGGLLKRARNTNSTWIESVVRETGIPFVIVFVFTMAFAYAATYYFPHAHTLAEVMHEIALLN